MAAISIYNYSPKSQVKTSMTEGGYVNFYISSLSVQNTSGGRISNMKLQIVAKKSELGYSDSENLVFTTLYDSGSSSILFEADEKKAYTGVSFKLNTTVCKTMLAAGKRSAPVYLYYSTNKGVGYIEIPNYFILDQYYLPAIEAFEPVRGTDGVENDEGINLLTTLKLGLTDGSNPSHMGLVFHYAENAAADANSPSIDLSANIPTLLTGVENDPDLITQTFDNSKDWGFYLTFGDEFESVTASAQIFKAFANLHLSGCKTGGVCVGGFSKSETGKPMLESYYRIYPYNGIEGVGCYSTEEIKTVGRWIDNKPIYQKTFVATLGASGSTLVIGNVPEDCEFVTSIGGVVTNGNGNFLNANYWYSTTMYIRLWVDGGEVRTYVQNNTYTGRTMYATIQYTKTTDEPVEDFAGYAILVDSEGYLVVDKNGAQILVKE